MLDSSSNSSGEIKMKSTRMIQAVAVAAVTLMAAAVFVSVVAESSDAAEANPTISDSGFIKDKKAGFYYSKFATSGFIYSDSINKKTKEVTKMSISGDSPTTGVGKVMQDNMVFASISKLNKDVQYYLAIEEHDKSGTLNYGVVATLKAEKVSTYVFMSVIDGQPYSEIDALTTVAMSGCANAGFTADVTNDIYYILKLTTDKDAKADILDEKKIENPLNFTKICHVEVKVNDLTDEVSNIGKNYGYSSTGADNYAGAALSYGQGTYLCCFFVSNVDKEKLEINVDASTKITVKSESILFGKNVTTGYAYFVLSQKDYADANFDKASVTIGENGQAYASESVPTDSSNDDNQDAGIIMAVGLAIVFICAILIATAYNGGHKEE